MLSKSQISFILLLFYSHITQVSSFYKIISFYCASPIYTAVITQAADHYTSLHHFDDAIALNFHFHSSTSPSHISTRHAHKQPIFYSPLPPLPPIPLPSYQIWAKFYQPSRTFDHLNFHFTTFLLLSFSYYSSIPFYTHLLSELCYHNQKLSSFSYFFSTALTKFHHLTR